MPSNDDTPNIHAFLQHVAEDANDAGLLDKAVLANDAELLRDPEWATPTYLHVHNIVIAFAFGVLSADPWYHGYSTPPGLAEVLDHVARRVQERWKSEVEKVTLCELEDFYRECIETSPTATAWNEWDGPDVVAVSRYSSTPNARSFIDLGALVRNAAVHVRDQWRREKAFDEAFERKYPTKADALASLEEARLLEEDDKDA